MQINIRAMCVMLLWIFCLSMFIDLWEHQNMKIEIFQKIQINIQAMCVHATLCIFPPMNALVYVDIEQGIH